MSMTGMTCYKPGEGAVKTSPGHADPRLRLGNHPRFTEATAGRGVKPLA
jgi:hypothetical protein